MVYFLFLYHHFLAQCRHNKVFDKTERSRSAFHHPVPRYHFLVF